MAYRPYRLLSLWPAPEDEGVVHSLRRSIRFTRQRKLLEKVVSQAEPSLSTDGVYRVVTDRLVEKLELLKQDFKSGHFENAYRLNPG